MFNNLISNVWLLTNRVPYSFNEYDIVMPGEGGPISASIPKSADAVKFVLTYQKLPWKTEAEMMKAASNHISGVNEIGYDFATQSSEVFYYNALSNKMQLDAR